MISFPCLMLITHKNNRDSKDYLIFVEHCLQLGVKYVQLREKKMSQSDRYAFAQLLLDLCHRHGAKLIINDDIDIALQVGADGVHLGQDDGDVISARKQLPYQIIGITVNHVDQLKRANAYAVDYVGISAVFKSANKHNIQNYWTAEMLGKIGRLSLHPAIAVGGVNLSNVKQLLQYSIAGVAAIDFFHQSNDLPYDITRMTHVLSRAREG